MTKNVKKIVLRLSKLFKKNPKEIIKLISWTLEVCDDEHEELYNDGFDARFGIIFNDQVDLYAIRSGVENRSHMNGHQSKAEIGV